MLQVLLYTLSMRYDVYECVRGAIPDLCYKGFTALSSHKAAY